MKKILIAALSLLITHSAWAQSTCTGRMVGPFTPDQSRELCSEFGSAVGQSLLPSTTNTYDLGSASYTWNELFLGSGVVGGSSLTVGVTGSTTTFNSGGIAFASTGDTLAIDSGTAASACKGTGTFNGTTAVVVSTTCAATGMHVSLTPTSDPTGTTAAYCWVTSIVDATSFTVDCDQANDGTFSWVIIKEG